MIRHVPPRFHGEQCIIVRDVKMMQNRQNIYTVHPKVTHTHMSSFHLIYFPSNISTVVKLMHSDGRLPEELFAH